jgi:hypothetical protein
MKAKQLYFVLIGLCCLAFLAIFGVAFGANKILGQQATKLSNLRALNTAAQNEQTSLLQDKADIIKYGNLNTIAASIVPQDKDQAQAVRQIVNIAAANGIKLTSITFPTSTLGATSSGSPKPGLTQLEPVNGISGVYNLQITITLAPQDQTPTVPYSSFLNFLSGLEQNRRTAEVTSVNITPDPKNPNKVSFTLVVNEFIKP